MKKELLVLVICLVMVVPPLSVITTTSKPTKTVRAEAPTMGEDCGCNLDDIPDDHTLLRSEVIEDVGVSESGRPLGRTDLPVYFSWKDVNGTDWTTPAKDQGNCGSCWDFAAVGALESIIQIREGCPGLNLDLSEQYVLSCLHVAGSCKGGSAYNAYRWIRNETASGNYCNGIIPEFCFPYQVNDDIPCANASPDWEDFLMPITTYGKWNPHGSSADREAIKTQILQSGPVAATMLFTYYAHGENNLEEWGWTHHDPTDYYAYPGPFQQINHQVVIVGWKDDASITNGGYWIVKNSCSPEWGYDGFFNLEYGSLKIDAAEVIWVDYDPANYSNWVPVAHAMVSCEGLGVTCNGSTSFDHEGSIVSYLWDFGDGTTTPGIIANHVYTSPGIYPVTLTVTDNDNYTGTDSTWAYANTENEPPSIPTLQGTRYVEEDKTYNYTFFAADPDGDSVSYYLNWGDTYWDGGSMGWLGPYPSGQQITLQKTWEEKGNYTIRVKAADTYGAKSDWATLRVTTELPPINISINGGLGITTLIHNNGKTAYDVNGTVSVTGLVFPKEKSFMGSVPAEGNFSKRAFVLGLGPIIVNVTIGEFSKSAAGTVFAIFVVIPADT